MLDCDNIRKDAVPSLDNVTRQTAVPNESFRRSVRVYIWWALCSTNETALYLYATLVRL
jgi:hypothetical protein